MSEKPLAESQNYLRHLVTTRKEELLEHVPVSARSLVNNLLHLDPRKRADHDKLLNGRYFKDPLSKMNEFRELFFTKTSEQQKEFLCLVGKGLIRGQNLAFNQENEK